MPHSIMSSLCARTLLSSTVLLVLVLGGRCSCPEVKVTGGAIVGSEQTSADGRSYFAYTGIPYADSPEGEQRFMPPQPLKPWNDVLKVDQPGPYCSQAGRGFFRGQEDCLHLSVYSPQMPDGSSKSGLPVLVWLHGGAFVVSGAADYDPSLIMDRDVVLVVPQYRLGFFGFIYAFDAAPGNYGMLDQVAALQWVQDNIAQFGGDPTRVTLGGDCAGGASALYHMIAPKSQGLFHGVVSVAGTPLDLWAMHPALRRTMVIYASQLGCPRAALGPMTKCFKAVPEEILLNAQGYLLESGDLLVGNGYLTPVVQAKSIKEEEQQFLMEEPLIALSEGRFSQVPVLLMGSKDEGNYIVGMTLYEWMVQMAKEEDKDFTDKMVSRIIKELGIPPREKEEEAFWEQYLSGLRGAGVEEKVAGIAQMLGDALYNTGLFHTARYLNDKTPTWMLRFDFEDGPHRFTFHPDPAKAPPVSQGAGHLDQLNYFLPEKFEPFTTPEQKRVSKMMLDIIDNFVNGRPPGPEFLLTTDEELEAAVITKEATLARDSFLPPDRVNTAEMMFKRHHVSELYKLGTPPPRYSVREEL